MDHIQSSCEKQYPHHTSKTKSNVTSIFKTLHLCLKEHSRAQIDLLKHQFKQLQEIKNKKDSNFYGCHVTLDEENLNRLDELERKVEELHKNGVNDNSTLEREQQSNLLLITNHQTNKNTIILFIIFHIHPRIIKITKMLILIRLTHGQPQANIQK